MAIVEETTFTCREVGGGAGLRERERRRITGN